MISGVESSPYQKRRKKIFLQRNWYFCSEKKGRLIESRLPFCPGRVIRCIIMATLKNPHCSNLSCIWFEDLQPPPFANNHFPPFCFPYSGSYQGVHILKMFECRQNWWMGRHRYFRPESALEDLPCQPMSEEASVALWEHKRKDRKWESIYLLEIFSGPLKIPEAVV